MSIPTVEHDPVLQDSQPERCRPFEVPCTGAVLIVAQPLDGVVTIAEAADYLKVTRQTIHRLINSGDLRRFKVGSCTRIPAADVLALVGGAS